MKDELWVRHRGIEQISYQEELRSGSGLGETHISVYLGGHRGAWTCGTHAGPWPLLGLLNRASLTGHIGLTSSYNS